MAPPLFSEQKQFFFKDVYQKVKGCPKEERELMPHIVHAIKLLLINPATSCTPERSFQLLVVSEPDYVQQ